MVCILKGYEINNFTFDDGRSCSILTLHFAGCAYDGKTTRVKAEGVPVIQMQYKGDIQAILPSLMIDSAYTVLDYYDNQRKKRMCNGLFILSEVSEVKK